MLRKQERRKEEQRAEAMAKLPNVLEIQKKKLLIAINLTPTAMAPTFSLEDEQSVAFVTTYILNINEYYLAEGSSQWNESKTRLEELMKNHAVFELSKYLNYAKLVCHLFLKNRSYSSGYTYIDYVLIHARQYGDPTKPIFKIDDQKAIPPVKDMATEAVKESQMQAATKNIVKPDIMINVKGATKSIVKQAARLIEELKENYNETNFMTLNKQITSFALLILRRRRKEFLQNVSSEYLVIDAYLNTDDEKTKKSLYDTFVKYKEWYKMQLPYLFFRALDLYGIEAGELWDLLCSAPSSTHQVALSLINLSSEYYKYHQSNASLLQHQPWFPYCRYFNRNTYENLSDKPNETICMLLNLLGKFYENLDHKYDIFDYLVYTPEALKWAKVTAKNLLKKNNT